MSAFDNLSLGMIPVAWKDGKAYSAIPTETSVDVLEPTRIVNTLSSGMTWDGNTLVSTGVNSGAYLELSRLGYIGFTYELTLTASLNGSAIQIYAEGNTNVALQDGTNTYTFQHSGSGTGTIIRLRFSNDQGATLSNISLNQITNGDVHFIRGTSGTRVFASGLLQTITDTNAPRLDYTYGGSPSILVEPQRENLITYSEDLTQTGWTTNGVTRTNDTTVTNPTGGLGATKVTGNGSNGYHNVKFNFPATGSTVTHSVFVKADNLSHFEFIETYGGSPYATAQYDLQKVTATITSGTLFSNARIRVFPNGWYRCTVVASAYNQLHFNISDGSTTTGITTVGSDENIYMWGAQTEAGSYPTSYIATSGTTVTRSRDDFRRMGYNGYMNVNEGTFYVESRVHEDFDGLAFLRLKNRTARNFIEFYYQTSNLFVREKISNTFGAQTQLLSAYSDVKGQFFKMAVTYNSNGTRKIYVNGSQIHSGTDGGDFDNIYGLDQIQYEGGTGCADFKSILYFNRGLTDSELEKLTSSDITQVLASYNNRAQYFGAFYESSHVETKLNELF